MSDTVIIAGIGAVVSLLSLLMTLLIKKDVGGVHKQLNSMRTEENKTNKDLGHAEGKAEGKEEEKAETAAKPQDEK